MFEVELLFQAENELSDAYYWYEGEQAGLGTRLFSEVNHYLGLIEKNPYHFQVRYPQGLRAAALRVFPYLIIYWIDESTSTVYVTSIFHTSRKPIY